MVGRAVRRCWRRRIPVPREDRGSSPVEFAIVAGGLLVLTFTVVQVGLVFYARSIALAAATQGVSTARGYGANDAAGRARAQSFLDQAGDGLTNLNIAISRGPTDVTVTVTGSAISVRAGSDVRDPPKCPGQHRTGHRVTARHRVRPRGDLPEGGHRREAGPSDHGSAAVELAILAPAVLTVMATLFIAGRTVIADQSVDAAAFDAARTASLARDARTAQSEAEAAAASSLAAQGINCVRLDIVADVAGFTTPVGQPAEVRVTINCMINNSDVAFPGMPGTATLSATFTSPLDQYRSRK